MDYAVTNVASLRGVAFTAGLGSAYPILAIAVLLTALWHITKTSLPHGLALGLLATLLAAYHVGDYDYTLAWFALALLLAEGSWIARGVALLGVCWLGWQLLAPAAIIPLFALIWIVALCVAPVQKNAWGNA
jgi:hypothetical protein